MTLKFPNDTCVKIVVVVNIFVIRCVFISFQVSLTSWRVHFETHIALLRFNTAQMLKSSALCPLSMMAKANNKLFLSVVLVSISIVFGEGKSIFYFHPRVC